jgi:hypothetical protein
MELPGVISGSQPGIEVSTMFVAAESDLAAGISLGIMKVKMTPRKAAKRGRGLSKRPKAVRIPSAQRDRDFM